MRITQIDYYVNIDHKESVFPPVYVTKDMINMSFNDYRAVKEFVDKEVLIFRDKNHLPDAVAVMHVTQLEGVWNML